MPPQMFPKKVVAQIANEKLVTKRHKQIVHAANKLFSKKGYHSTTMREISASSGINLSYIYKYVSSKDDILYLFYQHLHNQWGHIYRSLEEESSDPVTQLANFLHSMLEIVHKSADEIITMYTESRHLERDSLYSVLAAESEMIQALEKLILRGMDQGVFNVKDSFVTASFLQFLLVVGALRRWNFKNQFTFERFSELFIDFVFSALGVKGNIASKRRGKARLAW